MWGFGTIYCLSLTVVVLIGFVLTLVFSLHQAPQLNNETAAALMTNSLWLLVFPFVVTQCFFQLMPIISELTWENFGGVHDKHNIYRPSVYLVHLMFITVLPFVYFQCGNDTASLGVIATYFVLAFALSAFVRLNKSLQNQYTNTNMQFITGTGEASMSGLLFVFMMFALHWSGAGPKLL